MDNFKIIKEIKEQASQGKFKPVFENIVENYSYPEWFSKDKLGIFIHWGLYSVPAFENEWYPNWMYADETVSPRQSDIKLFKEFRDHHEKTYGPIDKFGYKDFIPMFKAEKWNPEEWISLFKKCGAKYIIPVAEHHDGFPMYDCPFTEWNSVKMGPKRDVVKELAELARSNDMHFGVSTHRAFNWYHYTFRENYDNMNPEYSGLYGRPHPTEMPADFEFIVDWIKRTWDLIDRFQPDILYFDMGWHLDGFARFRPLMFSYYYNRAQEWGKEAIINFKKESCPLGSGIWDVERGQLDGILETPWQTDTSLSFKSWCYIENDEFRTPDRLIHDLVDIVSKNGNMLINVGPKSDGTISAEATSLLLAMGEWLEINGEAIYNTSYWHTFGEGPNMLKAGSFSEKSIESFSTEDIRYTVKGNVLYATVLGVPENITTMFTPAKYFEVDMIKNISILGVAKRTRWSLSNRCLTIEVPEKIESKYATVFKIEMKDAEMLSFDEIKTKSSMSMSKTKNTLAEQL